jgi:hypothetical protein
MFAIVFALFVSTIIAYFWVRGIDNMKKNHPDYKGEDFLNWDENITKSAGRDGWDDNTVHTEGDF